jgi:O-antigen/teichoic acid export membrane protein
MSIMTKVYLLIDLVLLGWLVRGPALGQYAAASKLLTVLAGLSGIVMGGALPGLSSLAHDRAALERLVERVWHWLVVLVVPMFVAVALFAPLLVHVTIGAKYAGAVPLLRILCIAGEISVLSNLAGTLMITLHKTRALFIQNSAAIVLNIAGNVILVPIIGVSAAAWMTAATELLVCGASLFTLRREVSFRSCARASARPGIAVAGAAVYALALGALPLLAAIGSALVFVAIVAHLNAWPAEFRLPRVGAAR